jgi:hypothetical protein
LEIEDWGGIDWFDLAQDRDWSKVFVNTVMNGFHKVLRSSLVAASQEGLSSMKVVNVKIHCFPKETLCEGFTIMKHY